MFHNNLYLTCEGKGSNNEILSGILSRMQNSLLQGNCTTLQDTIDRILRK